MELENGKIETAWLVDRRRKDLQQHPDSVAGALLIMEDQTDLTRIHPLLLDANYSTNKDRLVNILWATGSICTHHVSCSSCGTSLSRQHGIDCSGIANHATKEFPSAKGLQTLCSYQSNFVSFLQLAACNNNLSHPFQPNQQPVTLPENAMSWEPIRVQKFVQKQLEKEKLDHEKRERRKILGAIGKFIEKIIEHCRADWNLNPHHKPLQKETEHVRSDWDSMPP